MTSVKAEKQKILEENELNKRTIQLVEMQKTELKDKIEKMTKLILNDGSDNDNCDVIRVIHYVFSILNSLIISVEA